MDVAVDVIAPANTLLAELDPLGRARLARHLRLELNPAGATLWHAEDEIIRVYFPLTGSAALIADSPDGGSVQACEVGAEGMLGLTVALGGRRAPMRAVTICDMKALTLSADVLRHELLTHRGLWATFAQYAERSMADMARSIACVRLHPVPQRLARWLLEHEERVGARDHKITQACMAELLGVQRPTLTLGLGELRARGVVEHRNGLLRVVDVWALREAACSCYLDSQASAEDRAAPDPAFDAGASELPLPTAGLPETLAS